jgi:transcriptional regulator GlxA family with amidase domain
MIRQVAFLIYREFQLLDAAGPIAAFEIAERHVPGSYALKVIAAEPGLVASSSGASMQARPLGQARGIDTLIVAGGEGSRSAMNCAKTRRFIRACALHARRTTSVCSGSFMLAAAGLLDGKRATTHWSRAADFARKFPKVRMEPDCIFVKDGTIWTSAGITAGIDLSLAMIEADLGETIATCVPRRRAARSPAPAAPCRTLPNPAASATRSACAAPSFDCSARRRRP